MCVREREKERERENQTNAGNQDLFSISHSTIKFNEDCFVLLPQCD